MIIFPAIDIHNGECVRLIQGDFCHRAQGGGGSAGNRPVPSLRPAPAGSIWWIWTAPKPGGGSTRPSLPVWRRKAAFRWRWAAVSGIWPHWRITFDSGIARCILGSAALKDPAFVAEAVKTYGNRIAVGIDAKEGMVAAEGWLDVSDVSYLELARKMEAVGVQYPDFHRYLPGRNPDRPQSGAAGGTEPGGFLQRS